MLTAGQSPKCGRTFSCTNRDQFREPHVITYPQADASKICRIRRERRYGLETERLHTGVKIIERITARQGFAFLVIGRGKIKR